MKLRSWIMYLVYRTRHSTSLVDLPKLTEVVMSVDSVEHCDAARRYVELYKEKHINSRTKKDAYTITAERVINEYFLYLADTRDHCEKGYHTPAWNKGEPVRKYPDMNNYVGKILNVRFKPFWERGVSSIAGPK